MTENEGFKRFIASNPHQDEATEMAVGTSGWEGGGHG